MFTADGPDWKFEPYTRTLQLVDPEGGPTRTMPIVDPLGGKPVASCETESDFPTIDDPDWSIAYDDIPDPRPNVDAASPRIWFNSDPAHRFPVPDAMIGPKAVITTDFDRIGIFLARQFARRRLPESLGPFLQFLPDKVVTMIEGRATELRWLDRASGRWHWLGSLPEDSMESAIALSDGVAILVREPAGPADAPVRRRVEFWDLPPKERPLGWCAAAGVVATILAMLAGKVAARWQRRHAGRPASNARRSLGIRKDASALPAKAGLNAGGGGSGSVTSANLTVRPLDERPFHGGSPGTDSGPG